MRSRYRRGPKVSRYARHPKVSFTKWLHHPRHAADAARIAHRLPATDDFQKIVRHLRDYGASQATISAAFRAHEKWWVGYERL